MAHHCALILLLAVAVLSEALPLPPPQGTWAVARLSKRSPSPGVVGPLKWRETPSYVKSAGLKGGRAHHASLAAAYDQQITDAINHSAELATKADNGALGPRKRYRYAVQSHNARYRAEDLRFKKEYHLGRSDHFADEPPSDARPFQAQMEVDGKRKAELDQLRRGYVEESRRKGWRRYTPYGKRA